MRNYKIKHSKRNIKKVFTHVFGEVRFVYFAPRHGMNPRYFNKPPVELIELMRYMLVCHWI